jgi:SAM-dependent methyltransferase
MELVERVTAAISWRRLTPFELAYVCLEVFMPPLYGTVRKRLMKWAVGVPNAEILDVGGRKSHYTIGVTGRVTISELERTTEQQVALDLGVTDTIIAKTCSRRSNVRRIVIDDMTKSSLPDDAFDCVTAVEVLEHVEDDHAFIREVHRVLRPGGIFLMTTPNGDWVTVGNPDHKRHYRRDQLQAALDTCFDDVQIDYAIRAGALRTLGLRPWSTAHPVRTMVSMLSNVANRIHSASAVTKTQSSNTKHLIATARKAAK